NMVERLIILSDKAITDKDVRAFANPDNTVLVKEKTEATGAENPATGISPVANFDDFPSFQDFKDHTEMEFIKYKLEKNRWNVTKTDDEIDIQRSCLYCKSERFVLKREQ